MVRKWQRVPFDEIQQLIHDYLTLSFNDAVCFKLNHFVIFTQIDGMCHSIELLTQKVCAIWFQSKQLITVSGKSDKLFVFYSSLACSNLMSHSN